MDDALAHPVLADVRAAALARRQGGEGSEGVRDAAAVHTQRCTPATQAMFEPPLALRRFLLLRNHWP